MVSFPFWVHVKLGQILHIGGARPAPRQVSDPRSACPERREGGGLGAPVGIDSSAAAPKLTSIASFCYNRLQLVLIAPVLRRRWHGF